MLAILSPEERRASILNFALLPSQLSWFLAPITGAALVALAAGIPSLAPLALRVPFGAGALSMLPALLLATRLSLREARHEQYPTGAISQARPEVQPEATLTPRP